MLLLPAFSSLQGRVNSISVSMSTHEQGAHCTGLGTTPMSLLSRSDDDMNLGSGVLLLHSLKYQISKQSSADSDLIFP
ncbi:unnamed protein product [Urochloa humidicola]